jgi:hypothetical protein
VCGAIRVGLTDPEGNLSVSSIRLWLAAILLLSGAPLLAAPPAPTEARPGLPLSIGQRTVHVFRVPLGMFSPQERVDGARKRIELAIEQPGEGWTSARPTEQGIQIEIDSKPLFLVLPGDANTLAGETPEDLANQATRVLQKVWSEARERRDPRAAIDALLRVALATVLLVLALVAMVKLQARLRQALSGHDHLPAGLGRDPQSPTSSSPGWRRDPSPAQSLTPIPRRQRDASSMPRCGCLPSPWPTPTCPARTPRPSRACR